MQGTTRIFGFLAVVLSISPAILSAQTKPTQQSRNDGFWIGVGLGYGSLGCGECDGTRAGALASSIRLGGTVSPKVRVGVSSDSWIDSGDGLLTMNNLSAVVTFFPKATGGFHLTGGLGLSTVTEGGFDGSAEVGAGGIIGIGYDAAVGGRFSLTPYMNLLVGKYQEGTLNMLQFGIAATWP